MNTSSNISDLLPKDLANKVGGKDIKNFGLQSISKPAALGYITNIKQKLSDLIDNLTYIKIKSRIYYLHIF
jgi:hypothetical protein